MGQRRQREGDTETARGTGKKAPRGTPRVQGTQFIYHSLVSVNYPFSSDDMDVWHERIRVPRVKGTSMLRERPAGNSQPSSHKFPKVLAIGNG